MIKNDKIIEMEIIVDVHKKMIEAIEEAQNWKLFDCKYTEKGIEFKFFDCNTENNIIMTLEAIEKKENDLEHLS